EIIGGELSIKMQDFENKRKEIFYSQFEPIELAMDSLDAADNLMNEKAKLLQSSARNSTNPDEKNKLFGELRTLMENNEGYSEEALIYKIKGDSLHKEMLDWQNE